MKIAAECIPCLLTRILFETNLVDGSRAGTVMKESCGIINSELAPDACSAELATLVHKRAYDLLGCIDPYQTIKDQAMSVCRRLEDKVKGLIASSGNRNDRLYAAIKCAIVGNVLDFGIRGGVATPDELITSFDKIYSEGLGYDDVGKIFQYLTKDAKILFFTDNCGEIVFDKLLCQELNSFGVKIILVVKKVPILSDATLKEARDVGMDAVVDQIITTGDYAVGLNVRVIDPELLEHLQNFDLIISKGMANFEALSETQYKPVLYLLRTKCQPVASALNLPKDLNVAKLID